MSLLTDCEPDKAEQKESAGELQHLDVDGWAAREERQNIWSKGSSQRFIVLFCLQLKREPALTPHRVGITVWLPCRSGVTPDLPLKMQGADLGQAWGNLRGLNMIITLDEYKLSHASKYG